MDHRNEDHAAIAALESEYPAFMVWCDRYSDGEAVWFAAQFDNVGDLLMAPDPVALGQVIQDAVSGPHPGIVATDAGSWISGPCYPTGRTPPGLLSAAVAAAMVRNGPHHRRWLPAALLRLLGQAVR